MVSCVITNCLPWEQPTTYLLDVCSKNVKKILNWYLYKCVVLQPSVQPVWTCNVSWCLYVFTINIVHKRAFLFVERQNMNCLWLVTIRLWLRKNKSLWNTPEGWSFSCLIKKKQQKKTRQSFGLMQIPMKSMKMKEEENTSAVFPCSHQWLGVACQLDHQVY